MPWYKEVSRQEWKTFLTTFAAWTLDAFDFTIITFVLTDIRRSFEVNLALAGALATVTLLFRMVGGIVAGTLADRYGRKGPILFSIAWYTAFAFLSGLSTSYVMLFTFRGLFGIGMGGMWAAGMPLALEQWPAKHRGIASGILQGGYSIGFLLSSLVYQLGYPLVSDRPECGVANHAVGRRASGDRRLLPHDACQREPAVARAAAPARRRARPLVAGAVVRSRPALGHAPYLAADGRLRLDVPVDHDLVSDAPGELEAAAAGVSAAC